MTKCFYCLSALPPNSASCPVCHENVAASSAGHDTSPVTDPRHIKVRPLDRGRFVAGTLLGKRYRIIGLLGRGGMGDVYKAEDLKLAQLIAVKVLPDALSNESSMLSRFHREVRTARQITHSNVCRVYDIEEVSSGSRVLHFLSMEYIDGENLATLLRRIGYLPGDKALELSRQICSGLAAAHELGVLHRDLKPANIMLDGRGRARITDFGLAGLAEEFIAEDVGGTPAYMAPEVLKGSAASARSDVYSLGLVLYEVFTGKRPFEGKTVNELIDQHENATPSPLSRRIRGIDPLVERAILRCLAKDPLSRPASPGEVLAALPGGDPLSAALAAGETPSPEMVAAAGEKFGLRPALAWASLIAIVAVTIAVAFFLNPAQPPSPLLTDTPEVFAHKAKEILGELGYSNAPRDSAYGFELYDDYVKYRRQNTDAPTFKARLARDRPGWIRFWYRQSTQLLMPQSMQRIGPIYARLGTRVTQDDPPNDLPEMAKIVMDSQGRLLEFSVIPRMDAAPSSQTDWPVLFRAAGIDESALTRVESAGVPAAISDMQQAWTGTWPGQPDALFRVEAAAWRGRPVFFQITGSWGFGVQQPKQETIERFVLTAISIFVVLLSLLAGSYLAWRNVRLGRSDRQGAFRLALFAFCILMLSWLTGSDYKLDPSEFNVGLNAFAECVAWSAVVGIMYLAIEPFVRKRWPHALISWNRVLEGRFSDPLVGRDLLVGVLSAAVLSIIRTATLLLEVMSPMLPEADVLNAMRGNAYSLSFVLALIFDSANIPLALFFLFCFFRIVFRNPWIAAAAFFFLINAFVNLPSQSFSPNPEVAGVLIGTVFCSLWLLAVTRFGLVGGMSMWFADRIFRAEIMVNPSGWHAGRMFLLLGAVGVLAGYAFIISFGNRPILSTKVLDQHS